MQNRTQTKRFLKGFQAYAELCNLLKQKSKSRFSTQTIHVNDVIQCGAKLYLDRISDTSPDCGQLNIMHTGTLWEKDIVDFMKGKGFFYKVPLFGYIYTVGGTLNIIGTPDFLDDNSMPDTVIELITTYYSEISMNKIVNAQTAFLRALGITIYDFETNDFKIFHNSLIKLSAFMKGLQYINSMLDNIQFLYIFLKDGIKSFKFDLQNMDSDDLKDLDHYYEIFLDWINNTIYALRESEKGYNENIFLNLLRHEICSNRILNSYQCHQCPYRQQDRCPSIPPVRKWKKDQIKQMTKFKEFWKSKGFELPSLPAIKEFSTKMRTISRYFIDPKKNKACVDRRTGKTVKKDNCENDGERIPFEDRVPVSTEWAETIAWVKAVREILEPVPLPTLFLNIEWLGFLPENINI